MMETIKVNMNPNPLDVQTIHASQNDGEARQWGFELHNDGEKIDSSSISDQLVFKAYKGGTEQLLPENTSTPTTSPFIGDIKYPQGLLNDQEFTYRQSPTEEDGLARIKTIKGNTIKWNQLIKNGNFASTSGWSSASAQTLTIVGASNNRLLFTSNSATSAIMNTSVSFPKNHKLLFKLSTDLTNLLKIRFYSRDWETLLLPTNLIKSGDIQYLVINPLTDDVGVLYMLPSVDDSVQHYISNVQVFDLTQMGLDSLTVDEFTSLFPLPYYSYNQGTLLSFNGNGIKTVGFNQWDEEWENGAFDNNTGEKIVNANRIRSKNIIRVTPNETYYFKAPNNAQAYYFDGNMNYIGLAYDLLANRTFVVPSNMIYMYFAMATAYGNTYKDDVCINISSDENGIYKSHESHTTNLPISTYFPTGMKSAGNVYDELTESKAITRVGAIDLGSLSWNYHSQSGNFYAEDAINNRKVPLGLNAKCSIYQQVNEDTIGGVSSLTLDKSFAFQTSVPKRIIVKNTSYTDATSFKTAMSGVYLYYEMATPTETSFSTASLVTENAEIPLSNDDGVLIGKCTEQLSAEPGFHDVKIKLSDSDGDVYSNKIQLHVERSPQ